MSAYIAHSWIIPAYQDERSLEQTVKRSAMFLEKLDRSFEIILVNDGSTDRTQNVIDRITHQWEFVRSVHHPCNRGYGQALQSGFRAAQAKLFVGYTDGDGQYDPMDLYPACVKLQSDENTAVIGYKIKRQDSFLRIQQSRIYNTLIRRLFEVSFRDINCSLKWFPADTLRRISFHSQSSFIDAEILLALTYAGVKFHEIPVQHFARQYGRGNGAKPKVVLSTLRELFTHYSMRHATPAF